MIFWLLPFVSDETKLALASPRRSLALCLRALAALACGLLATTACNQLQGNEEKILVAPAAASGTSGQGGAAGSSGASGQAGASAGAAGQAGEGGMGQSGTGENNGGAGGEQAGESGASGQGGDAGDSGAGGNAGAGGDSGAGGESGAGGGVTWGAACNAEASPGSTEGLFLWLRGDNLAGAPGDEVATWPDARCALEAQQPTPGERPRLVVDQGTGLAMARFDGVNDWLDLGDDSGNFSQGFTLVAVVRTVWTVDERTLLSFENQGDDDVIQFSFRDWKSPYFVFKKAQKFHGLTFPRGAEAEELRLITLSSKVGEGRLFANGTEVGLEGGQGDPASLPAIPAVTRKRNELGRALNKAGFLQGDLGELLVFRRSLSDDERATVEGSLLERWGLCPGATAAGPLGCGVCGRVCAAGEACEGGACVPSSGVACSRRLIRGSQVIDVCEGESDWVRASHHCASIDGQLWNPTDDGATQALQEQLKVRAYMGAGDQGTEGTFGSLTGQPLPPPSWASGEPSGGASEQCMALRKDGSREDIACGALVASEWPCLRNQPIACYPRWLDGRLFNLCFAPTLSFQHRQQLCESRGEALAGITSADRNLLLAGLATPFPESPVVIGANDSQLEGTFTDPGGGALTFAAWSGGSPAGAGNTGDKDCVALHSDGLWRPIACNDSAPTLCEHPGSVTPACPPLEPPAPSTDPNFILSNVDIGGQGPVAQLSPGQPLDLTVLLDYKACNICPGCQTQIGTFFFPGPWQESCGYNSVPGCKTLSQTLSPVMNAPTIPGVYELRGALGLSLTCAPPFGTPHQLIGRLCVL